MAYPMLENDSDTQELHLRYQSFLLRCWQEETDGEAAWRFTLVQMGGKRSKQGFASLEAAVIFIRKVLTESAPKTSGGYRS